MSTPSPARTAGPAAPPAAVLPGAASASVRSLLTGAARPARLLADFGRVAYLDLDGDLLALSAPGAVRLPFAVTVTGPLPALVEPVLVGDGAIRAAGVTVRVRRWWRPPIPRAAAGPRGDHEVRRLSELAKGVEGHDRDPAMVERARDHAGRERPRGAGAAGRTDVEGLGPQPPGPVEPGLRAAVGRRRAAPRQHPPVGRRHDREPAEQGGERRGHLAQAAAVEHDLEQRLLIQRGRLLGPTAAGAWQVERRPGAAFGNSAHGSTVARAPSVALCVRRARPGRRRRWRRR